MPKFASQQLHNIFMNIMNATSKMYVRSVHCNVPIPRGSNCVVLLADRASVRSQLVSPVVTNINSHKT